MKTSHTNSAPHVIHVYGTCKLKQDTLCYLLEKVDRIAITMYFVAHGYKLEENRHELKVKMGKS